MPPPAVPRHRPDQPHGKHPGTEQRKAKGQSRRRTPRRQPWLFFCPLPAPIGTTTAPINTGKDHAAHGDDLPNLPGLGGVGLPDEQRTARPITCPACSFQPDPAAALMTPPPCCRTHARPTDNASRQPASTPPPAQRRRGQILHLTG